MKVNSEMPEFVSDLPLPAKDKRFPSQNQALNCWNKYNEFVKCAYDKGEDKCQKERYFAKSMCPSEWVEKWDGDRDGAPGKFAGVQAPSEGH